MSSNDKSGNIKQLTQRMRRIITRKVAGQRVEKKIENLGKLVDEYFADRTESFGPYACNQLISEIKASVLQNAQESSDAVRLAAATQIDFSSVVVDDVVLQITPPMLGIADVNLTPRLLVSPSFRRALPFFLSNFHEKKGRAGDLRH